MKKNKSIDGLTIRTAADSSVSYPKKKKPAPKTKIKVAIKETKAPSENLELSPENAPISSFPIIEPTEEPNTKPTKPVTEINESPKTREQKVEDFLKPVQAFDLDGQTGELKVSKKAKKDKLKDVSKKPEKKKPSRARRIITSIILILVLAIIGLVSWAVFWGNDIIAKITGGQGNVFDLIKFIEPTYEPLKTDINGRTNILAFGTSGYDMSGDEGNGVHAGAQLTDSIMMISLNQETGDIAMLSLPRDLKASPTCTATSKINEVYWCNGGGYDISTEEETEAATALMEEVSSILGVDFQYFAHLNWGSLITVVDILGGIDITLDEDINDYGWTGAVYEAGVTYHINGEEALGLARARHGTAGGDFSRGASQQKILIGIKDKFLAKETLSINDFLSLVSTLGDNFRSNFSIDELKSIAHLTFDFDFDSTRQISLWPDFMTTGTLDNGISYVFPRAGVGNYGAIQDYVATNLSNDPRTYEEPSIIVLNATDELGLAAIERDKLTEAGYYIYDIDNAPEGLEFKDNYTIYTNGEKPGTKDMLAQFYNITIRPISEAPEVITRDYDFVIILGPTPTPEEETTNNQ